MASPEQEAMARQNGYPSYEAMVLWAQQRYKQRDAQTIAQAGTPPGRDPRVVNQQGQTPAQQDPRYSGVTGMFRYIGDALAGKR